MSPRPAIPPSRRCGCTTPLRVLLATTAALWLGNAAPQSTPSVGNRPINEIRFWQFFQSPVGEGGLQLTDTLLRNDGQEVRLTGYMVQQDKPPLGQFMLSPRPMQMSEHADGDADDLPPSTVMVYLAPHQANFAVPYVRGLIEVSGVLHAGRHEAVNGRVVWVHLQLPPEATRGMSNAEVAGYLHSLTHWH